MYVNESTDIEWRDGALAVVHYNILSQDFPCAQHITRDNGEPGYRAWSRTQFVGDYDDWQIRTLVEDWCAKQGIDPDTLLWYEEPEE